MVPRAIRDVVSCGGVVVRPGDAIVAGEGGAIAVPCTIIEQVIRLVEERQEDGGAAITEAPPKEHVKVFELLLATGGNKEANGKVSTVAALLCDMAEEGDLATLEGFLVQGTDVNGTDANGGTARMVSTGKGRVKVA